MVQQKQGFNFNPSVVKFCILDSMSSLKWNTQRNTPTIHEPSLFSSSPLCSVFCLVTHTPWRRQQVLQPVLTRSWGLPSYHTLRTRHGKTPRLQMWRCLVSGDHNDSVLPCCDTLSVHPQHNADNVCVRVSMAGACSSYQTLTSTLELH